MGRSDKKRAVGVEDSVMAVDAGQSTIKIRLRRGDAPAEELALAGIRTHEPLLPQLAAVVQRAAEHFHAEVDVVSFGVSGLTRADFDAARLAALLTPLPIGRICLAHDSVTSYLGALGERQGVVVAAGTGVVTLGVGASTVARVDGWGYIMGDAGSGYWIGQQALQAVMRSYDGRGPHTALTERVAARWPALDEAYIRLQSSASAVAEVAAFSRDVAELAEHDDIARQISTRAAHQLADSAASALEQTTDPAETSAVPVCTVGGVFGGGHLAAEFARQLQLRCPRARLTAPQGAGIDGAGLLPAVRSTFALARLIDTAAVHKY